MKLAPSEVLLTGQWTTDQGHVLADDACRRIDELTRATLQEMGRDSSGWDVLYRDFDDGRFWELTYPQSHLHGGGPPQLRCLTLNEAKIKYGDVVARNQ